MGRIINASIHRIIAGSGSGCDRLEDHTLYVSRVFKWYSGDFNDDVAGFFRKYAEGDLKSELEAAEGRIKVKYLEYDWSLNGQ